MKKSKFTEAQIAYALRQAESGTPVPDVGRQMGCSEASFYVWKKWRCPISETFFSWKNAPQSSSFPDLVMRTRSGSDGRVSCGADGDCNRTARQSSMQWPGA